MWLSSVDNTAAGESARSCLEVAGLVVLLPLLSTTIDASGNLTVPFRPEIWPGKGNAWSEPLYIALLTPPNSKCPLLSRDVSLQRLNDGELITP